MKIGNLEVYGIIYKITNIVNSKVYIGQTINGFDNRYAYNIKRNTHNKHLKSAIHKYGMHNFQINKVFDIAFSKEELDIKEDLWINYFNCINNGYNNQGGGSNGKPSEETLKKLSESHKGKNSYINKTPQEMKEFKKRMSEARKGENNPLYGRTGVLSPAYGHKLSVESRNKISEKLKGRFIGENNISSKKVICLETFIIYPSAGECSRSFNCTQGEISSVCNNKRKSTHGYHFMYYSDYINSSQEDILNKLNYPIKQMGENHPKAKCVVCLEDKKVFNTIVECGKYYNCSSKHISSVCKKKRKQTGGHTFIYYEEYILKQAI